MPGWLPSFACGDVGLHYAHCSAFLGVAAKLCVDVIPQWHWYWLPPDGASTTVALQCAGLAVVADHCYNQCRNSAHFSFCMASSSLSECWLIAARYGLPLSSSEEENRT